MRPLVLPLRSPGRFLLGVPCQSLQSPSRFKHISFAAGASSATVKGSISGDKIVDYKLGAKAGQTMSVTLKTSNLSNYFNVLPPGSDAAPLHRRQPGQRVDRRRFRSTAITRFEST